MSTHGVPPNGFQGAAQQTHAVRNHLQNHMGAHSSRSLGHTVGAKRGKRKTKVHRGASAGSTVRKAAKRAVGSLLHLKKGSAAAKAWGAKMHKMRKKKAKPAAA